MKKRQVRIGLVERAVLVKKWHDFATSSQINMLIGDCSEMVLNYAGRMVYVALMCAKAAGFAADDGDYRVLCGTANALHDQVGLDEVVYRQALQSGVYAAMRVAERVGNVTLVEQVLKMELLLRAGHLRYSDFVEAAHGRANA